MPESTRRLIRNQLSELDANERDASLLRVGGAMVVFTLSLLSAYTAYYARLTARKGYEFVRAAAALVVVLFVYRTLTYGARRFVAVGVERAIDAIRSQDRVDDRVALLALAAVCVGVAYGLLKLARWCVKPFLGMLEVASHHPMTPQTDDNGNDDDAPGDVNQQLPDFQSDGGGVDRID